jgi:diadenosine tetraphosphate (Ap4A) HIT family hydrolase
MTRSTEEDAREYGLAITNGDGPEHDVLEFLRGSSTSIYNGERNRTGDAVFFHVHPHVSPNDEEDRSFTSPLISTGDLTATAMQDYGGGYLNIVNANGLTLHIGSSSQDEIPRDGNGYVYTVESGPLKGEVITVRGDSLVEDRNKNWERTIQIMKRLKETGQSYCYSIFDKNIQLPLYFLHVPWQHIDPTIDVHDLCFGEGLKKILESMELGDIPQSKSLLEAMVNMRKEQEKMMYKRLQEFSREDE